MTSEILLDFIPQSQKNRYERSLKFTKGGGRVRTFKLKESFKTQREKLMWLLKQLEPIAPGQCFCLTLVINPAGRMDNNAKVWIHLTPFSERLAKNYKGADPDGVLTTVLDALKLSGRIPDDGLKHVKQLLVQVENAD